MSKEFDELMKYLKFRMKYLAMLSDTIDRRNEVYKVMCEVRYLEKYFSCENCVCWDGSCERFFPDWEYCARDCKDYFEPKEGEMDE